MSYNLLVEPWIPVLWRDGRFSRVGIREALQRAGRIRQIAASNPMDNVALLRFLLAVLLWCKPSMGEEEKSQLAELEGIPERWLEDKLVPGGRPSELFDLLGDGVRFYQDAQLQAIAQQERKRRPVGDLLAEFPGADSVNHMRHVVHDGSYGLCPACCALGILRLSVWAPANAYYPSSVNPASAAYSIVDGKNLLGTLVSYLPEGPEETEHPPWLSDSPPASPGAVAFLAWRPRRLWLIPGNEKGACAHCGTSGALVTHLYNEGGWTTPATEGQRFSKEVEREFKAFGYTPKGTDDGSKWAKKIVRSAPLIFRCRMDELRGASSEFCMVPTRDQESGTDAQELAGRCSWLIREGEYRNLKNLTRKVTTDEEEKLLDGDAKMKKFWDADPHLLRDGEPISLPGLDADTGAHSSRFWRHAFSLRRGRGVGVSAVGPVVNKFTFQDAVSLRLPDLTAVREVELSSQVCSKLLDLLKRATPDPELKHPEVSSALVLLTPDAEARIRGKANRSNVSAATDAACAADFLRKVYAPMVEQIVASTIPGSPLRRREAKQRARLAVVKQIDALTSERNDVNISEGGTDGKRPRRKRGRQ